VLFFLTESHYDLICFCLFYSFGLCFISLSCVGGCRAFRNCCLRLLSVVHCQCCSRLRLHPNSSCSLVFASSYSSGGPNVANASPGAGTASSGVVVLPTELHLSSPSGPSTESSSLQLVGCYGNNSANHSS
jgi:hypothetical protein